MNIGPAVQTYGIARKSVLSCHRWYSQGFSIEYCSSLSSALGSFSSSALATSDSFTFVASRRWWSGILSSLSNCLSGLFTFAIFIPGFFSVRIRSSPRSRADVAPVGFISAYHTSVLGGIKTLVLEVAVCPSRTHSLINPMCAWCSPGRRCRRNSIYHSLLLWRCGGGCHLSCSSLFSIMLL